MCDPGDTGQETIFGLDVDDSLEGRLKAHGISRRNIRSIIHEIFSDENVMKLLKTVDSEPELDFPDAPLTRSKRKREVNDDTPIPLDLSEDAYDCCYDTVFDQKIDGGISLDNNTTMDSICKETCDINADSCYNEDGEFDWQTWLAKISDNEQEKQDKDEDYNSEEDPDFNFLAEQEEPDIEDFRNDCATRVSKKELKSLTVPSKNRTRSIRDLKLKNKKEHKTYTLDDFLQCKTMREKLIMLKSNPELQILSKKRKKTKRSTFPVIFTEEQKHDLKQQLQQHVQLLAQTCVLEWDLNSNFQDASTFLCELEIFRQSGPEKSQFDVLNLRDSIDIVQYIKTSMSLNSETEKVGKTDKMQVMSRSPAFMYRELLPHAITEKTDNHEKQPFSFHEDCLIAHGLHEMSQDFYLTPPELISQLLMPHRSKQEISSRIKLMMMAKNHKNSSNPINQYKHFGVLPPPHKKIAPISFHSFKPIEMEGKLPEWLQNMKARASKHGKDEKIINHEILKSKGHQIALPCKLSAKNMKRTESGELIEHWNRSMDEKILTICKKYNGPGKEALFLLTCAIPTRSKKHIRKRFHELMAMYCETVDEG